MFEDTSIIVFLLPIFIAAIIVPLFLFKKFKDEKDPAKRLSIRLRYILWSAGAVFLVLWFLLPMTPVLSTFGYPQSIDDLTPRKTLGYLQSYNHALVRTIEIIHWALFIGLFWVGAGIEAALREYNAARTRADGERAAAP